MAVLIGPSGIGLPLDSELHNLILQRFAIGAFRHSLESRRGADGFLPECVGSKDAVEPYFDDEALVRSGMQFPIDRLRVRTGASGCLGHRHGGLEPAGIRAE
jgi:hypothetical protein